MLSLKGKIYEFQNILIKCCVSCYEPLLNVWEKDVGMESNDMWLNICNRFHFPFTRNKIKEANFKLIHECYLTPLRLHKLTSLLKKTPQRDVRQ